MCLWPLFIGLSMALASLVTWLYLKSKFKAEFMHKIDQLEIENHRLQINLNNCKDTSEALTVQVKELTEENANYLSKLATAEADLAALSSDSGKALSLKTLQNGNAATDASAKQVFDNLADMQKRVATDNYTNPEQIAADVDMSNIEAALSVDTVNAVTLSDNLPDELVDDVPDELTNEQIEALAAEAVVDIDAGLLVDLENDKKAADTEIVPADVHLADTMATETTVNEIAADEIIADSTTANITDTKTNTSNAGTLSGISTGERSAFITSVLGGVTLAATTQTNDTNEPDDSQQSANEAQTDANNTTFTAAKTVMTPYGSQYQNKHAKDVTDEKTTNDEEQQYADNKLANEQPTDDAASKDKITPATNSYEDTAKSGISFDKAAAKAALGKNIKVDDLKVVEGIGPKIAGLFNQAGIHTWLALAKTPVAECKKILDNAGSRYQMHDPSTWPEQANLAAKGAWEELATLQDSLKGGRKV